jgi:hypothetical protein
MGTIHQYRTSSLQQRHELYHYWFVEQVLNTKNFSNHYQQKEYKTMIHAGKHPQRHLFWLGGLIFLLVLLAGCGGGTSASSPTASSGSAYNTLRSASSSSDSSASGGSAGSNNAASSQANSSAKNVPAATGPQYLIKTLNVNMSFKDTKKAADDLQSWITATDPRATSAGLNYQQVAENYYNINMTFSVQASLYPQIEQYLRDYAPKHGGQLTGLNETVKDVTNDYVDTQSRLKILKGEQARLLALLNNAQKLSDVLTLEQRLTDVEGNIESTEANLNNLTSQITFYPVVINLQAITPNTPPPVVNAGWSAGQTFHDALAASLGFAQGLATFLIWLLAYSPYIIVVGVIVWLVRRARNRRPLLPNFVRPQAPPVYVPPTSTTSDAAPVEKKEPEPDTVGTTSDL